MGNDRKSRKKIKEEDHDLLKPLDILSLGSDDDPCFGKHHDLLAKECKSCGDSEFCAIVMAQGLHQERLNIESKQRFKDIEESDKEGVKKKEEAKEMIAEYRVENYKRLKTILVVSKRTGLTKDTIKQLYDQN